MIRSNRVLIVAHCVLNQNTVVSPLARSKGAFQEVVTYIMAQGYGIHQLPCPETQFLGLSRLPMTKEEYNTDPYKKLCITLTTREVTYWQPALQGDVKPCGIVGISQSPTCSQTGEKGHFIDALNQYDLFKNLPSIDIPESFGHNKQTDKAFLIKLECWLSSL